MEPGCGIQLALKMVTEHFGKPLVVSSVDEKHVIRTEAPYLPEGVHCISVENPASFAGGMTADRTVVCFADEATTEKNINSVEKSGVMYVCYNTSGIPRFAKKIGLSKYSATASVAYPADLMKKLDAMKSSGNGFIEILCPCPKEWGFESSNTVVVSRSAVESGLWHLYEIMSRKASMTYRPAKLEPLDIFLNLQHRVRAAQEHVNLNWKLASDDRIWETI